MAENVEKNVVKNDKLVVEGNLMLTPIKDESGNEKRIVELAMISYEKIAEICNYSTQHVKFICKKYKDFLMNHL